MFADVLILGTPGNFEQILTYNIPREISLKTGSLVSVPVRQRLFQGLVLAVHNQQVEEISLKDIKQVLSPEPVISERGIKLADWLTEDCVCSLNKVIQLFLPPSVRKKEKTVYLPRTSLFSEGLLLQEKDRLILELLQENQATGLSQEELERKLQRSLKLDLEFLLEHKYIRREKVFVPKVEKKTEIIFQIKEDDRIKDSQNQEKLLKNAPKQRSMFEMLKKAPCSENDLKAKGLYNRSALQGLLKKELIGTSFNDVVRNPLLAKMENTRPQVLNQAQEDAYQLILASSKTKATKWLLYGITGSGKTEVYLRIMEKVISQGKQALYLVPEISLTPQVVSLLVEVFGDKVAILHSALSDGERYDHWWKIKSGKARVVLGARSAVFAPFSDLGLIIIDEEHENTYKQNEPDPRYDTHRVAEKLAELFQAILLKGSATPSLRSFYQASQGEYQLLRLPERVTARPLPEIEIIDLKKEIKEGNRSIFSRKLIENLQKTIKNHEQAILFMNRRGFHTYVMCKECGKAITCPHCQITLIYHQSQNKLVCHYCHYQRAIPKSCAFCGSTFVRYFGTGTERVATEFAKIFPDVSFIRMDTDTTQRKDSHMKMIKEFREGKAQVLIGTQMVAKGLDFPLVTLVGVVNPDFLLNMPDYQAGERAYQLLTQVAGRAGRGAKPGKVMMQTFDPEHYLFSAIKQQDYEKFYQQEIANRHLLQYPPFTHLVRIMVSGYQEKQVLQRIEFWAELLQKRSKMLTADLEILGPSPAPLGFLKKRFRYHIIIKGRQFNLLQDLARQIKEMDLKNSGDPRTIIDIGPQNLL